MNIYGELRVTAARAYTRVSKKAVMIKHHKSKAKHHLRLSEEHKDYPDQVKQHLKKYQYHMDKVSEYRKGK